MEPEVEGDEEDYYVASGYDELVGTPSTLRESGPGYWPSSVLDGLISSQPAQQLVSQANHPLATVRVSSGSSHTSLELPSSTPVGSGSLLSDSSSSSSVEIEVDSTRVRVSPSTEKKFDYTVKLMKTSRKSDYTVHKLHNKPKFSSLVTLHNEITSSLNVEPLQVGYFVPGHGLKGKQEWLNADSDLKSMYDLYTGRKSCDILLWCQCVTEESVAPPKRSQKRSHTDGGTTSTNTVKRAAGLEKIAQIEEIVSQLQEKHGTKYSVEKLNCWAHLILMKKHASYDNPPEYPYFKGKGGDTKGGTSAATSATISPGKRVNLRSECMDQLDKSLSLLRKGCITQEQYDNLRDKILKDMSKF